SVVVIGFVAAVYWFWSHGVPPGIGRRNETGEFLLVDAGDRALDGAPALALTFTLPLDSRKTYDPYVTVFEIAAPAAPARTPRAFDDDSQAAKGGSIVSVKAEDTDT